MMRTFTETYYSIMHFDIMSAVKANRKRILVVGDLMVDRFVYGKVERISPEAPIPVLRYQKETVMPGGAGNVAMNLVSLGCDATVIGAVGRDAEGRLLGKMLEEKGIAARLIVRGDVPTTIKTRYIAGKDHLLREDRELAMPVENPPKRMLALIEREIKRADVVVLSDYGKGFLTERICQTAIMSCRKIGKIVVVDPKGDDYTKYRDATLVKPNLKEFSEATGRKYDPSAKEFDKQAVAGAKRLISRYGYGGVLVTLGEHGMLLVRGGAGADVVRVTTRAREVFDVSGAGDTALAALAMSLADGKDLVDAVRISNVASGIAVSKLGTATVTRDEMSDALRDGKVMSREEVARFAARCRKSGKRVGFTNGCFDCCHLGHLSSLAQAKALCDVLVVGVNTDEWIRAHKGTGRPIQDEATRVALLSALSCVDAVVLFGDETALPLVKVIRPDVIAKEGYALEDWPEGRWVTRLGGKAVTLKRKDGYSTTSLARRLAGVCG